MLRYFFVPKIIHQEGCNSYHYLRNLRKKRYPVPLFAKTKNGNVQIIYFLLHLQCYCSWYYCRLMLTQLGNKYHRKIVFIMFDINARFAS